MRVRRWRTRAALVAMVGLTAGCAGETLSQPDGPLSFDFNCADFTVAWSEARDPYVGVVLRNRDAEPLNAPALDAYLECSSLGTGRGLAETSPTGSWANTAFQSDDKELVVPAPPGPKVSVQVGSLQSAVDAGVSVPSVAGGLLAIEVVEGSF